MVLDLNMPGMGGLAVLEQVKREVPQVQAIILTGHGSPEEEAEAKAPWSLRLPKQTCGGSRSNEVRSLGWTYCRTRGANPATGLLKAS